MSTIPDHLIDKAARAVQQERAYRAAAAFGVPDDAHTDCAAMIARAVLEAVADDLRADAWSDGYAVGQRDEYEISSRTREDAKAHQKGEKQ